MQCHWQKLVSIINVMIIVISAKRHQLMACPKCRHNRSCVYCIHQLVTRDTRQVYVLPTLRRPVHVHICTIDVLTTESDQHLALSKPNLYLPLLSKYLASYPKLVNIIWYLFVSQLDSFRVPTLLWLDIGYALWANGESINWLINNRFSLMIHLYVYTVWCKPLRPRGYRIQRTKNFIPRLKLNFSKVVS